MHVFWANDLATVGTLEYFSHRIVDVLATAAQIFADISIDVILLFLALSLKHLQADVAAERWLLPHTSHGHKLIVSSSRNISHKAEKIQGTGTPWIFRLKKTSVF